jgi:hypothetical protein
MVGVVDDDIGLKETFEEAVDIVYQFRSELVIRDLSRVCLTCRLTNATPLLQRRQKQALGHAPRAPSPVRPWSVFTSNKT